MQKYVFGSIILLSGVLGFLLSWYIHYNYPLLQQEDDVQTIETFHYPALLVQQLKGDPLAGKKIFQEFCTACHGKEPLIDIKAPRIGDRNAWEARRRIGMQNLLQITTNGAGAMPARGGCFECSDEQLREAIQYILDESVPEARHRRKTVR